MVYVVKLFTKVLVQLIGVIVLIPLTCKYKLGEFPGMFKYWDDYRGRLMKGKGGEYCVSNFGRRHCNMYHHANQTWYRRYIWAAFRNACNYFQHDPLGKIYGDDGIFHYHGMKRIFDSSYYLRYNIGYKYYDDTHAKHMLKLGIPLQFVFSIGIRKRH